MTNNDFELYKVAIADSSLEIAQVISDFLSSETNFKIIGFSDNIDSIRDSLRIDKADLLIVDVEIAHLLGIDFISEKMKYEPLPIIATTSSTYKGRLAAIQALEIGALDTFVKPANFILKDFIDSLPFLKEKIYYSLNSRIDSLKTIVNIPIKKTSLIPKKNQHIESIIIGCSFGSFIELSKLIENIPENFPSIVVCLDLSPGFTKPFADRLNEISSVEVKEAIEGDLLEKGKVYIAPGDFHLKIGESNNSFFLQTHLSEKVNSKRPSIDLLMFSAAENLENKCIGVLLSGCGEDGVLGMKSLKMSGAKTFGLTMSSAVNNETIQKAIAFDAITDLVDYVELIDKIHNNL